MHASFTTLNPDPVCSGVGYRIIFPGARIYRIYTEMMTQTILHRQGPTCMYSSVFSRWKAQMQWFAYRRQQSSRRQSIAMFSACPSLPRSGGRALRALWGRWVGSAPNPPILGAGTPALPPMGVCICWVVAMGGRKGDG